MKEVTKDANMDVARGRGVVLRLCLSPEDADGGQRLNWTLTFSGLIVTGSTGSCSGGQWLGRWSSGRIVQGGPLIQFPATWWRPLAALRMFTSTLAATKPAVIIATGEFPPPRYQNRLQSQSWSNGEQHDINLAASVGSCLACVRSRCP